MIICWKPNPKAAENSISTVFPSAVRPKKAGILSKLPRVSWVKSVIRLKFFTICIVTNKSELESTQAKLDFIQKIWLEWLKLPALVLKKENEDENMCALQTQIETLRVGRRRRLWLDLAKIGFKLLPRNISPLSHHRVVSNH